MWIHYLIFLQSDIKKELRNQVPCQNKEYTVFPITYIQQNPGN